MRELKFRAWDKKRKRMFAATTLNASGAVSVFIDDDGLYLLPAEQIELMQYTGLKDKNGKEIYEGDIVEYTTCYYGNEKRHRKVVEWEEWDSDDFGEPHNLGYFDLSEGMEIVGNIHENPELLEGKE